MVPLPAAAVEAEAAAVAVEEGVPSRESQVRSGPAAAMRGDDSVLVDALVGDFVSDLVGIFVGVFVGDLVGDDVADSESRAESEPESELESESESELEACGNRGSVLCQSYDVSLTPGPRWHTALLARLSYAR